ncbi:hypothetical protein KBX73_13525 [Acetobacter persici]|uniref:hypothetical protein n=1 Tax=Acetobacter persici TaxID=1076596 RepID=UPI0020CF1FC0|nr:hypothetical protein [Acetobacter persici]MCP9320774.1 hypothetical protein [Acetobacter persici]
MPKNIGEISDKVRKSLFIGIVFGGIFTLSLAACSSPPLKIVCPEVVPWTAEFQHQIADEIRANPNLVALPEIARQDVTLRDQVRACQKEK